MGNCECSQDSKFCGDSQNGNLNINEIQNKTSISVENPVMDEQSNELTIQIRTWQKESYSLFDYENQNHLRDQNFKIQDVGFMVRKNNEVHWIQGSEYQKEEHDVLLFQIARIENNLQILIKRGVGRKLENKENFNDNDLRLEQATKYNQTRQLDLNKQDLDKSRAQEDEIHANENLNIITKVFEKGSKIWLVVRSVQNQNNSKGIKLMKGDIIKMGRIKFKIREIKITNYAESSQNEKDIQQKNSISSSSSLLDGLNQCRVCLSTTVSAQNPLINPCKCAGTMKYIHLECLQTWLRAKLHSRYSDHCIVYLWKNLECELCKFNYPPVFKSDDTFYDLVELSKPKDIPYMLLEITQKKYEEYVQQQEDNQSHDNRSNGVYIISFQHKKELRVGRAHETEVRVNDISVSRQHALIKLITKIDNEIYINDTKSKFGTLIQLQQTIPLLEPLHGLELQVGRSVVQFHMGKDDSNNQQKNQKLTLESCLKRDGSVQDIEENQ